MSDPAQTAVQYAEAFASWREDSPVPEAADTRLTLQLESLRGLSAVRRQVRAFLLASVAAGGQEPRVEVEDVVERAVLVIDELASSALRHGSRRRACASEMRTAGGSWSSPTVPRTGCRPRRVSGPPDRAATGCT